MRVARDDLILLGGAAAVAGLFFAAERHIAGAVGFPLDDAWIHLRFAENLVAGRGFGINPGEPVAGSTAPLWTLGVAGLLALGLPGLWAAKALGLGAHLAAALLTRRLALAVGQAPVVALAAGLAVVGLGRLGWGALSGMEVPLAASLVAAGALAAARDRPLGAATLLGLATLARPEAGLLVPLHVLAAGRLGAAAARAAVSGLVLAPMVAFSWLTVGRLVPATAAAKVEGGLVGRLEGVLEPWSAVLDRAGAYLVEWVGRLAEDHAALPALALAGLVVLRRSRLRWLVLALVLHPVVVAVLAPYRGPAFQTGRYSSHLLPLAVVAALAALDALLAGRPRWRAAGLLVAALPLLLALGPAGRAYAWGVQNINAMQVTLGHWVARHTRAGAVLAVNDIGALTYFGDRRVLDLMGLVTPDILPYRRAGPGGILRYLERTCPDYLVIFPAWFPSVVARADLFRPVTQVHLPRNEVAGADTMIVYETVWHRWAPTPVTCPGAAPGRASGGSVP